MNELRTTIVSRLLLVGILVSILFNIFSCAKNSPLPKNLFTDKISPEITGPRMVTLPAGSFQMGSAANEWGRYDDEGPVHTVFFTKGFALGLTEVTVAEFKLFVDDTKYLTSAESDTGSFFRDTASGDWRLDKGINWRHDYIGLIADPSAPVVHVSWHDAQAFVAWLSKRTQQAYRLPTEAEMEYAIRAGTTTTFWWGSGSPSNKVVNIKGEFDKPLFPEKLWYPEPQELAYALREGPTPLFFEGYGDGFAGMATVGSFKTNPFGLHDISGKGWEWTQDCWHPSYKNAPNDGRAWTESDQGDCKLRVVRGGSFYCFPRHIRSANRWILWPVMRTMYVGFRVARDI